MRIRVSASAALALALLAAEARAQTVMDALRRDILADMARDCAVPSGVAAEPGAFSRSGDRVTVRLGLITCPRWTFGTNPHCGARYCQTDVYDVSGATYELIESRLE